MYLFSKGYVHVLTILDKKGGKPKLKIESQDIIRIDIHSEDINQLTFKVLCSTAKKPLCLYAKTVEEVNRWVSSLLVAVSKGIEIPCVTLYVGNYISLLPSLL